MTEISFIDMKHGIIYFMSTEEGSTQRHLYLIHFDGKKKKRLSPTEMGVPWKSCVRTWKNATSSSKKLGDVEDGIGDIVGNVGYYEAQFTPGGSYYILSYTGPDVPYQKIISTDGSGIFIFSYFDYHYYLCSMSNFYVYIYKTMVS